MFVRILLNCMEQTFGATLREVRRSRNVSQRKLAELIGVDFSYISKVENDRLPPPAADTIVKISEALNVSSETLLSLTDKLPSEIRKMFSNNSEAMKFVNAAQRMNLSREEWELMTRNLKKLR